jgi:hypothetical protein
MPQAFPRLKTGALGQYPISRELSRPMETMQFLDMGRQLYANGRGSLRRWQLRLARLDETEMAEVIEFFAAARGSLGRFEFEDPMTGEVVANCRFAEDELLVTAVDELDGRTILTVMETR